MSERELFVAALQIADPQERSTWLDHACGGDAVLRQRIDVLLQALDRAGSLLDNPVVGPQVPPGESGPSELAANTSSTADAGQEPSHEGPDAEQVGVVLAGRYKLVEQIGEGGMGTVWMAQQTEPVKRAVAVKLIKLGMDSRQVLARFEAERQALALMDHPNIARVLDGGTTENGRPFFVMELVKGVPLIKYCDEHRLAPRQRLELFASVCQAVQHAHQKGIIHRDLKPSNILVAQYDGRPVPKVIDFGIAKAAGQQLTDKTLMTGFGAVVGTLEYMSPEQAESNQLDIDTRSDIYSLGVLLYELLTGSTPLDRKRLKKAALAELLRIIREEEPQKPSTRLSGSGDSLPSISAQRQMEPAKLTKLMRGELDWIVMKALDKDRNRRYETANGLLMDVQRYLADEPVQACPPSAWYRLRKFVRRNKGRVLAAAVMLVLLLAGTAVSIWQAVRATHAEQQTTAALDQVTDAQTQTREALDTLTDDVVETLFTKQAELGDTEKAFLRKVLGFYEAFTQQSGKTVEARFLQAKGYYKIAHLSGLLGDHSSAVTGYRQSEALIEQLAGEYPDEAEYRQKLARTEGNLGVELAKLGKEAEAETAFLQGIRLRTKLAEQFPKELKYRLELANNYTDLGHLRELRRKYAEAEAAYNQALELKEKLAVEASDASRYHLERAITLSHMGQLLRKQAKYAESEKVYRQALNIQQEQLKGATPTTKDRQWLAGSFSGLGIALAELGREEEAATAFRRSLEVQKGLTEDFPNVIEHRQALASGYNNLGYFLTRQKKDAEAEEPYRQALELRKKMVAQAGPVPGYRKQLAESYHNLAHVLSVTRRPKEAESAWRAALEIWKQLVVDLPQVPNIQNGLAGTLSNLAVLHNQRREFDAAVAFLEQAGPHFQAALKARPKDTDFRESYRDYLAALAESRLGLADHARLAAVADELAGFGYQPAKDTYTAASYLCRCMTLADKHTQLADAKRRELARSYADRALALLRQAVERGFNDAVQLKKDPDFEPLRAREEYRKLVADLEGKTKK
jgi:tetratricopeptide (TPR) repeat protein